MLHISIIQSFYSYPQWEHLFVFEIWGPIINITSLSTTNMETFKCRNSIFTMTSRNKSNKISIERRCSSCVIDKSISHRICTWFHSALFSCSNINVRNRFIWFSYLYSSGLIDRVCGVGVGGWGWGVGGDGRGRWDQLTHSGLSPLLLTRFNFDPSMDK